MYKLSNGLSPPLSSDIFNYKNSHPYNLRHDSRFSRPLSKTVFHGTENILSRPNNMGYTSCYYKELSSLEAFKNRIKKMET